MKKIAAWVTAVAAMSAIGSFAAYGDQYETFDVAGTFTHFGDTLGGTISVDLATGLLGSANLSVSGGTGFGTLYDGALTLVVPNNYVSATEDQAVFSSKAVGAFSFPFYFDYTPAPLKLGKTGAVLPEGGCCGSGFAATGEYLAGGTITPLKAATAPEMDAASAASGLALLVGTLLVLRGRRGQALPQSA